MSLVDLLPNFPKDVLAWIDAAEDPTVSDQDLQSPGWFPVLDQHLRRSLREMIDPSHGREITPNSNRAEIFIRLRTKTESDLKAHVITAGRAIYRMLCSFFQTIETVDPYELTDMTKLTLTSTNDLGPLQANGTTCY